MTETVYAILVLVFLTANGQAIQKETIYIYEGTMDYSAFDLCMADSASKVILEGLAFEARTQQELFDVLRRCEVHLKMAA